MTVRFQPYMLAGGMLLLTSLGCSLGYNSIPTGEWSGQGTYIDYEARGTDNWETVSDVRSKDGVYETTLKITEKELFGHEAKVFEIRSQRGKLMNVDDEETHLEFTLVPVEELEQATLYAVIDPQLSPDPAHETSESEFRKGLQLAAATCVRKKGTVILQAYYILPRKGDPMCFFDTFVFEGNHIRKTGGVSNMEETGEAKTQKLMKVCWVEDLHKIR